MVGQERRNNAGTGQCEKDEVEGGGLSDEGWAVLFDDHAVGQVLGVVLEELGGGSRTVGQLQFF